jgi:hypothetical protein
MRAVCADFETELVEFNDENNHFHLLVNPSTQGRSTGRIPVATAGGPTSAKAGPPGQPRHVVAAAGPVCSRTAVPRQRRSHGGR